MDNPWDRYVSPEMQAVFSDKAKYTGWRRMWLAVAKGQRALGATKSDGTALISEAQIKQLEENVSNINIEDARKFERITLHDVTAHKKAYELQCPLAAGILHLGCTSRAITDNAELLQIRESLYIVLMKTANAIQYTTEQAETYKSLLTLGRTHFQPAQVTTVGRRIAMYGDDLFLALDELEHRLKTLSIRGIKGTVGTYTDMLAVFDQNQEKVDELEKMIAKELGFKESLHCIGQTYPRMMDYLISGSLGAVGIACAHFAQDTRLLQGPHEIEEPFENAQEGSSAMAYKRNPKNSERIGSLIYRLLGCGIELGTMASQQWLEGSVNDSALRRLAIPEMFFATDAVLDLYMHNMRGIQVHPEIIQRDLDKMLPFMATNLFILEGVKKGGNRQKLYDLVHKHSQASNLEFYATGTLSLISRLASDPEFPLTVNDMNVILQDRSRFEGGAIAQTEEFVKRARERIKPYESQLGYVPKITV